MNLQALMAESAIPASIAGIVEDLVDAKRQTRERGNTRRFAELDAFMRGELDRAGELPQRRPPETALESANAIFLDLVNQ